MSEHTHEARLLQGDCLDKLRDIQDDSIDAVITDPPYGMDYQSAWNKSKLKPKIANDKRPFIWWLYDAYRVTRPGGALLCFCDWGNQDVFKMAIQAAGYEVKSQVIWDRGYHGMGDLGAAFGPQHDIIWFAIKGDFKFPNGRPVSVLRYKRISGEALRHPNEKPVELMRELVERVTPSGGSVLDPFAGSCATGVACIEAGRNFIGIELAQDYYELGLQRLGAAMERPRLALVG